MKQMERERERQTDRQRQKDRQTETETKTDRQREGENSNSKTLILKNSSVRSIWTYGTASPCYTTNTSSDKSAETLELNSFHGHTCIQQSNF